VYKAIRLQGSFPTHDSSGNLRFVDHYVDLLDAGTLEDLDAEIEGLSQLQTREGEFVNRIVRGKYRIVATGEILTSTDPTAP